ncbi:unnamed protein product [Amoebophrya sp. A120]|nr:unnamed protein product [Amoebophrya sp. A120]|eukprot:GSA120T00004772001.1
MCESEWSFSSVMRKLQKRKLRTWLEDGDRLGNVSYAELQRAAFSSQHGGVEFGFCYVYLATCPVLLHFYDLIFAYRSRKREGPAQVEHHAEGGDGNEDNASAAKTTAVEKTAQMVESQHGPKTEFLVLMLPILALGAQPQYLADYVALLLTGTLLLHGLLRCSRDETRPGTASPEDVAKTSSEDENGVRSESEGLVRTEKRILTEYRAFLLCCTSLMILAVDFPSIFPRRFSKCLTEGYSPMDLGVGSFVFLNGLVVGARWRKTLRETKNTSVAAVEQQQQRGNQVVIKKFFRHFPTLCLGFGRFITVAVSGHHVPPEEYGLHWNFFVTLFAVHLGGDLVAFCVRRSANGLHAVAFALLGFVGYLFNVPAEFLPASDVDFRARFSWRSYALANIEPRWNLGFLDANKEGVLSLPGFQALFLLAAALGRKGVMEVPFGAWAVGAGLPVLLLFTQSPSRRCCDVPYVLYIVSCNSFLLAALRFLNETLTHQRAPLPHLLSGLQDSMLFFFLLTNVLTGCVGQLCRTLIVPPTPAMAIVLVYGFFWMLLAQWMGKHQKKVKFW